MLKNGVEHIRTLWRDFDRDFGRDPLWELYQAAHQQLPRVDVSPYNLKQDLKK